MSEETPPESIESPENPKPKRKATRKRSKPAPKPSESSTEAPVQEAEPATPGPQTEPAEAPREPSEGAPVKAVRISERRVPLKGASSESEPGGSGGSDNAGESGEPIAVISEPPGGEGASGGGKRRRRRRRKPNQGEDGGEGEGPSRPKLDPDAVARRAWKIYLSEVSEEGLALISDQDAKELTRRSFRLAEIFLEEASRRQPSED